jgi:hypothetical protein
MFLGGPKWDSRTGWGRPVTSAFCGATAVGGQPPGVAWPLQACCIQRLWRLSSGAAFRSRGLLALQCFVSRTNPSSPLPLLAGYALGTRYMYWKRLRYKMMIQKKKKKKTLVLYVVAWVSALSQPRSTENNNGGGQCLVILRANENWQINKSINQIKFYQYFGQIEWPTRFSATQTCILLL